jgi:hypothetical protein
MTWGRTQDLANRSGQIRQLSALGQLAQSATLTTQLKGMVTPFPRTQAGSSAAIAPRN